MEPLEFHNAKGKQMGLKKARVDGTTVPPCPAVDGRGLAALVDKLDRLALAVYEDDPSLADGLASLAHDLEAVSPQFAVPVPKH